MFGDMVAKALAKVGVTESLVEDWLGDCNCPERRARLNALDAWTRQFISGRLERARECLDTLMRR